MRTFIVVRDGVATVARTYALGPGGRSITDDPADAGLEEIVPAPDFADEIARGHPEHQAAISSVREISEGDIPGEYQFKDAWRDDGSTVSIHMPKAREIHMGRIRVVRDAKLVALDVETIKAVGTGDTVYRDKIEAEKQALRDIPTTFNLSNAKTPAELLKLWPAGLDQLDL